MKRLIFVLVLLAFPLEAQRLTHIQPIITQSTDYTDVSSPELTIGYVTEANTTLIFGRRKGIRVVCTTACYISVSTPARPATVATGIYLPADRPFFMSTPGRRVVKVTASTANGKIIITEY